jgi:hypothetical protein
VQTTVLVCCFWCTRLVEGLHGFLQGEQSLDAEEDWNINSVSQRGVAVAEVLTASPVLFSARPTHLECRVFSHPPL